VARRFGLERRRVPLRLLAIVEGREEPGGLEGLLLGEARGGPPQRSGCAALRARVRPTIRPGLQ